MKITSFLWLTIAAGLGIYLSLYAKPVYYLYIIPLFLFIGVICAVLIFIYAMSKSNKWDIPLFIIVFMTIIYVSEYLTGSLTH